MLGRLAADIAQKGHINNDQEVRPGQLADTVAAPSVGLVVAAVSLGAADEVPSLGVSTRPSTARR